MPRIRFCLRVFEKEIGTTCCLFDAVYCKLYRLFATGIGVTSYDSSSTVSWDDILFNDAHGILCLPINGLNDQMSKVVGPSLI